MIPFFRKIRYRLAEDNQFLKYSRYAIGEIVLVVIGILIALQINTWKQEKEDRSYELKMINNIRNDLYADIQFDESLLQTATNSNQAAQDLLDAFGTDNDSLVLLAYPTMTMGISYDYRKGAYEALRSTGLDKISNDSIRQLITNIYDFGKPRMFRWISQIEEHKQELVEKLELELFDPEIVIDANGNKDIVFSMKGKNLLQDIRFLRLIKIYRSRAQEALMRLEFASSRSHNSLDMLNRELQESYPFEPFEQEEVSTVGILGTATETGWETDMDMNDEDKDGIFTLETTLSDGEVKFRANDAWNVNWGGYLFPSGYGMQNGKNIRVSSGHYRISLNIKTGFYQFEKIDTN